MKQKALALALAVVLLTACAAPAGSTAVPISTPTPAPTAAPTPEPTATPSPTPVPTMAAYDPVSFEDWRDGAGCRMPDYTFSAPYRQQAAERVAWPEQGVTLCCTSSTLEEAAERFHTTVDRLKELNPDWQEKYDRDGTFYRLKLQEEPYILPENNVVGVKVRVPWLSWYDRSETYEVPAGLDKQAQAALATAYFFEERYYGLHAGFMEQGGNVGDYWRPPAEGEIYTSFSEFSSFLHTVYSEKRFRVIADSDTAPFKQGENDTILSLCGDRGSNIANCGYLFTKPELQPDGSIKFYQIILTIESEDFAGWGGDELITPDTATLAEVRLLPTEDGWRVDDFTLPY